MPEEIELKLCLNAADIPRLKRSQVIRQYLMDKPLTRKLTSIYYDTPSLDLLKAGVSVRVRRMSGQWFQSIKTAGQAQNGLHARHEWEDLLEVGAPDFEKMRSIDQADIASLLSKPQLQTALKPIFSTIVRRTEWQLQVAQSYLELALDIGHVVIEGKNVEGICELEIELKSGHASAIKQFADPLKTEFALVEENVSKAQLGYRAHLKHHKN
jgi:triphosphatase